MHLSIQVSRRAVISLGPRVHGTFLESHDGPMSGSRVIAAAGVGLKSLVGGAAENTGLPIRVDVGRMLMKAIPAIEGGQRAVYFQASTETRDYQGDRILAKALESSIPYFLRHGRIDLDHASVTGQIRGKRVDPYAYEIGRPVDARAAGPDGLVTVKAEIFSSKTPGNRWCEAADLFWESLYVDPPVLWYPSVQGVVTNESGIVSDGLKAQEIRGMLWQSVGFSRNPVSRDVSSVTTVPLRVFAKAMGSSQGMGELLERLRSGNPSADESASADPGLTDTNVLAVVESLADALPGQAVSGLLGDLEARGIPQDQALAVMFALLTSPK